MYNRQGVFFGQQGQGGLNHLFGQQGCLKSEPRTLCKQVNFSPLAHFLYEK